METSPSKRITELASDQLEEFVEIWAERKSKDYVQVDRVGQANDKGRDVVGFVTKDRHEGDWDLFQCKRKTWNSQLELGEALTELGKVFYHYVDGGYATLPRRYVFVSPRGLSTTLTHKLQHPSTLKAALLDGWRTHCLHKITKRKKAELSDEIKMAIEAYDFGNVGYLTATSIAKDPAAKPALVQILGLLPDEAPVGEAPDEISEMEFEYLAQLKEVYAVADGCRFGDLDEVFASPTYGDHLRDQRTRFYEACAFRDFHRDNTDKKAVDTFKKDIYLLSIDVYNEPHASPLARVNAVMKHAGTVEAGIRGRMARGPVKQGTCHHLVVDGRIRWSP
jgi:hypothetical protein